MVRLHRAHLDKPEAIMTGAQESNFPVINKAEKRINEQHKRDHRYIGQLYMRK